LVDTTTLPAGIINAQAPATPIVAVADPDRDGVPSWDNSLAGLPAADNENLGQWHDFNHNGTVDAGEVGIYVNIGTNYAGADFGYEPSGTVGDFIFRDLNGNGRQDPGELGIANVPVQITNGSTTYNTASDFNGLYSFSGLTASTWTITVTQPAGTAPSPGALS